MYRKKTHIHFVGIGGIGMSGIAQVLAYQGYVISGCDKDTNQTSVQDLQKLGCSIATGHNTALCSAADIDVVVYSSAISPRTEEIVRAQQRGIPTIARALMLAELMRTKFSIAISGSHGKTTTTSLISHILIEAGIDPTIIIGGHLKNISSHARLGSGDFLVAEADESDRSLLHLLPTFAVVTNIDLEHLETYKNLDDIKQTFKRFISMLPFYGKAIMCIDDQNVQDILPIPHIKTITYGLNKNAQWRVTDVALTPHHTTATVWQHQQRLGTVTVAMPGKHNLLNALAAIAVAHDIGVPFATIAHALATFKGIDRRFSFKGDYHGAQLFDDYGHHPVEIANTLVVARARTQGKLKVIFQPHRYTRTKHLWQDFVDLFAGSDIDELIITDIWAASEEPIDGITSERLAEAIAQKRPSLNVRYVPYEHSFDQLAPEVAKIAQQDDLVLFCGAGKLNKLAEKLVSDR